MQSNSRKQRRAKVKTTTAKTPSIFKPGMIDTEDKLRNAPADVQRFFSHVISNTPMSANFYNSTIEKYPNYFNR